jgi:monoamine oxidase
MAGPDTNIVDVAIIGAGFAGLSAAHALREGGAIIQVLEAQEQAGGRVKTIQHADGRAYEKGGQFYCTTMTNVCGLVEKYGLTHRDVRKLPGIVAMLGGKRRLLETDFLEHHFFEAIFAAEPDLPGSLLDWVLTLGLDDDGIAMIKSGCEEVIGRPIEELSYRSVRDLLIKFDGFDNTMEFACVEGLGALAGLMARDLGDAFHANAPVTALDRRNGLFHLTTPSADITARKVIYAAGPAVLRQIDWKAPQDQWLKSHPDHFVAGQMIKIVLRYDSAFWLGSDYGWLGQTDNPSGLSVMDCSDPMGGRDALAVFCGGTAAKAMAGLSEDQVLAKVMGILEPMLGPKVRTPATVVQTNWTNHPWVGGGYDTWAKPWETEDPWAPMRRAHDGLHFTCAELAAAFPGFIEGATRSGQEVAARVLQEIGQSGT